MLKVYQSLLLTVFLISSPSLAQSSDISSGLDKLVSTLAASYRQGGQARGEKAAVFEFASSGDLEKRRIGFAVSELLTNSLRNNSSFVLIERLQLNRVLQELKLGMSGLAEQENAVKVGKLCGARLLVLGSVEKIGGKYHVNARLVDAETGLVSATAYQAFPVAAFEEQAHDYVVGLPDTQRIGVYLLYNWRYNPNSLRSETIHDYYVDAPLTSSVNPKPFNLGMAGVGLRYSPFKNVVLDIALYNGTPSKVSWAERLATPGTSMLYSLHDYPDLSPSVRSTRFLASARKNIGGVLACYLGAGATEYRIQGDPKIVYYTPTTQLRAEYYPQQRLGISFALNYDIYSKTKRQAIAVNDAKWGKLKFIKLAQLSLEPSLSLYF